MNAYVPQFDGSPVYQRGRQVRAYAGFAWLLLGSGKRIKLHLDYDSHGGGLAETFAVQFATVNEAKAYCAKAESRYCDCEDDIRELWRQQIATLRGRLNSQARKTKSGGRPKKSK